MPWLKTLLFIVFLAGGSSTVAAASRHADLDRWLTAELVPFVREQLRDHPRFRGESLRFVSMENGKPQAMSNGLTLRIRDQLREAVSDLPDLRIAWQPDDPHKLENSGAGGIDCTRSEVHYLIGIETYLADGGALAVELRALDVEDRTLVAGFSKSWQGSVSSSQYRDFRRSETDPAFRGAREVPYYDSETDLLAAHLAHDLGCSLLRQTEAEYVITESAANTEPDPVSSMLELVSNNLAQYGTLKFSGTGDDANSVIEGKAHRIDDDLYQYWVTVHARDPDSPLKAMSASAYVRLPERFSRAAEAAIPTAPTLQSTGEFLLSMKIVEMRNASACPAPGFGNRASSYAQDYGNARADCFALQIEAADDAVVFFLNHQLNNGLVRLADESCSLHAKARIARSGEDLQFTLPPDSLPTTAWSPGAGWQIQPDYDTYYAIGAIDTKAARALSQHIEDLPQRCSASVRPGLEGRALQRWMEELDAIIDHWGPAIDWQTIRVKNVY